MPRGPKTLRQGTWLGNVGRRLMGRWGARVGLSWVAFMTFVAVVAPFVANSRPILIEQAGVTSSPLLEGLAKSDVILVILFVALIALIPLRRLSLRIRTVTWLVVGIVGSTLTFMFVHPPELEQLQEYRVAEASGEYSRVIRVPLAYSPLDAQRDLSITEAKLQPPSLKHPMGTDINGYDVASRMIHGTRVALAVGLIATGIAVVIGVTIGGFMGYLSGVFDLIGMRLVEIFSAIPTIFLLIMIVAFYGRDIYLIMTVIGLLSWVGYALFIRAEFLKLRSMDYVQAARAIGVSVPAILFRHLLPNGITPVLVLASFGVASAILFESTLSFLGLGLEREPSWGNLLRQALEPSAHVGLLFYPGLAIFLTVFALNLIGEALRDALDPRATG